jgi:ribosomal protein L44E
MGHMEERGIRRLMTSVKCSSCGQNYTAHNVQIIGQHHGLWFIRAYCSSCHTHYLLAATVNQQKSNSVTDLSESELARFQKSYTPTVDDILDMHSFLKTFKGNFAQLFGRERVS